MKSLIPFSKFLLITFLAIAALSSCTVNRVYKESIDTDNHYILNSRLITPNVNIENVYYGENNDKDADSSEQRSLFYTHKFNPENEEEYIAKFDNISKSFWADYVYYYRIDYGKRVFIRKTLEYMIEQNYRHNPGAVDIDVNILNFDIEEEITFFNSRFIQNLELEFSFDNKGKKVEFVSKSVDTLELNKPMLSKMDNLVYKGVYKCAEQFIEFYRKNDFKNSTSETNTIANKQVERTDTWPEFQEQKETPFQRKYMIKQHPKVRFAGILGPYSYGAELAYVPRERHFGHFTNALSLKATAEYISVGFNPMFYAFERREGFFFVGGVDIAYFYARNHTFYNPYGGYSSPHNNSTIALNGLLGIGIRYGFFDLRLGGSYMYKMTNRHFSNTDQSIFIGLGFCL